jgi:hypothetical protein
MPVFCQSTSHGLSIDENQAIVKTDKIDLIWFIRFIENRSVIVLKNSNFEKLEPKKLSD